MNFLRPQYFDSYREYLHGVLKDRNSKNPSYSLRAFARDIQLSPARLSEIMRGRGNLGVSKLELIADSLCPSNDDRLYFKNLVLSEVAVTEDKKKTAKDYLRIHKKKHEAKKLLEADFAKMSEWYYLAIWNYLLLEKKNRLNEIMQEFPQLSSDTIEECLACLFRLNLIEKDDQAYYAKEKNLYAYYEFSSFAVRKYHKSMLIEAEKAIDDQEVDERYYYGKMLSLTKDQYDRLTAKINLFFEGLSSELGSSPKDRKNSVYAVNLQAFRLNKTRELE